jgi:hypothetical protein
LKFGSEVTELANLKAIAVMVKFATGGMLLVKRKPFLTLEHLNSSPGVEKQFSSHTKACHDSTNSKISKHGKLGAGLAVRNSWQNWNRWSIGVSPGFARSGVF